MVCVKVLKKEMVQTRHHKFHIRSSSTVELRLWAIQNARHRLVFTQFISSVSTDYLSELIKGKTKLWQLLWQFFIYDYYCYCCICICVLCQFCSMCQRNICTRWLLAISFGVYEYFFFKFHSIQYSCSASSSSSFSLLCCHITLEMAPLLIQCREFLPNWMCWRTKLIHTHYTHSHTHARDRACKLTQLHK